MAKGAYYNDNSREACATLRVLIAEGHIAPGDVDERSIKDVHADDLRGYTQVHMFAGLGLWSGAMRAAGWEDDRPAWSGSCPCQGFSTAGKGLGFDDPRHLWPDWFRLIDECQPGVIFGEQVAAALVVGKFAEVKSAHQIRGADLNVPRQSRSKPDAGEPDSEASVWLDLVFSNLESIGYACASVDLPAAGFAQGAHIRQRLDWVADRHNAERWSDLAGRHFGDWPQAGRIEGYGDLGAGWTTSGMGHSDRAGPLSGRGDDGEVLGLPEAQRESELRAVISGRGGQAGGMDNRNGRRHDHANFEVRAGRLSAELSDATGGMGHHRRQGLALGSLTPDSRGAIRVEGPAFSEASSLCGCDWLLCTDGRVRPVEAGTFPLAPSTPGRLGALRLFGNGLDFTQTVNFISAYMEAAEIMDLVA